MKYLYILLFITVSAKGQDPYWDGIDSLSVSSVGYQVIGSMVDSLNANYVFGARYQGNYKEQNYDGTLEDGIRVMDADADLVAWAYLQDTDCYNYVGALMDFPSHGPFMVTGEGFDPIPDAVTLLTHTSDTLSYRVDVSGQTYDYYIRKWFKVNGGLQATEARYETDYSTTQWTTRRRKNYILTTDTPNVCDNFLETANGVYRWEELDPVTGRISDSFDLSISLAGMFGLSSDGCVDLTDPLFPPRDPARSAYDFENSRVEGSSRNRLSVTVYYGIIASEENNYTPSYSREKNMFRVNDAGTLLYWSILEEEAINEMANFQYGDDLVYRERDRITFTLSRIQSTCN